jgi:hypothetical protein
MKITPVLQHIKSSSGNTMPVWEIEDFPIPNINIDECSIIGSLDQQNTAITSSNKRLELSYNFSNIMKKEWEYDVNIFMEHMRTVGYNEYSIEYLWFDRLRKFAISPLIEHTTIICDRSGLNIGPHLDNRNMFGIMILNIVDNPPNTGTEFSKDENGNVLYTSPTQKKAGCFFINTHETWHSIKNMSDKNRYILYIPIGI